MLEKYYKYKVQYNDYIIFLKFGNFYEVFDNDGLILNKLFNYKIKRMKNNIKVGFPINKLDDILRLLDDVNYVIIEKDKIVEVKEYENNKYNEYHFDINKVIFNFIRIDKIYNNLCDRVNGNLENILERIESII